MLFPYRTPRDYSVCTIFQDRIFRNKRKEQKQNHSSDVLVTKPISTNALLPYSALRFPSLRVRYFVAHSQMSEFGKERGTIFD